MKVLFASLLLLSFNAFAGVSTNEPKVNFDGTFVKITKTCLTEDGQHLRTLEPVKYYGLEQRAGRMVSVYLGKKILETSLSYLVPGKCLRRGPKLGMCSHRAPSELKQYELTGSYDVFRTRVINGKHTIRTRTHSVDYSVPSCL